MDDLEDISGSRDELRFKLSPEFREEMDRLSLETGFTDTTIFSRAFTLFRVAMEAYQGGGKIYIHEPDGTKKEIIIPGYNA